MGCEAECKIYSPVFLLSVWIRKIVPCRGMRKAFGDHSCFAQGASFSGGVFHLQQIVKRQPGPLYQNMVHVLVKHSVKLLSSLSFKRCEEMPGRKEAMCPGQIIALQLER